MWFNLFVFILLISTGYGYTGGYRPDCTADGKIHDCAKNQLCYKGKCYDGKGSSYGPPLCRDEPERNCLCGDDGDNVCKRYKWVRGSRIKQYCFITRTGIHNSCIPDTRAEMDVGDSPEEVEVGANEESVGFGTSKIKTQENFWDIGYKSIAIFGFGLVTGSGLVSLVLMNRKDPMKMSLLMDQEIDI